MPIEFLDLLDDEGWEPSSRVAGGADAAAGGGGPLAGAPAEVAAGFDGAAWCSTRIDPAFGLTGLRLRAGAVVPRHHHDEQLLVLVVAGSLTVHADEGREELRAGTFCVIDVGTPYALTAGPDGATSLTSWPQGTAPVTSWDPPFARPTPTSER